MGVGVDVLDAAIIVDSITTGSQSNNTALKLKLIWSDYLNSNWRRGGGRSSAAPPR